MRRGIKKFSVKFTSLIIGLFLLIACNAEIEKPEDLIPRDEMKTIIKEVYVYRQVRNFKVDKKVQPAEMNLAILDKHGVSLDRFQNSFNYYLINNAAYDEMLNEIKEELEAELPEDVVNEPINLEDGKVKKLETPKAK